MDEIRQMLFSLQRFQVLALFTNSTTEKSVSSSYAFAWLESVYPLLNDSAPWHKPCEGGFAVGREQLAQLYGFLSARWSEKNPISFYELEDYYGIRGPRRPGPAWNQADLIHACRYFYLRQQFDSEFWSGMLTGTRCPIEAESVSRKFDADDIYFE